MNKYLTLFFTTLSISATTNGGYAIVAVMKKEFVEKYHWFTEDEMMDYISIGQSTPGAIAINTSIVVGYKVGGLLGAFVALLGVLIPPVTIMSLVTLGYGFIKDNKYVMIAVTGMQAGVASLLVDASISMFTTVTKDKSWFSYVLIALSIIYVKFLKLSVLYLALLSALAGIIKTLLVRKKVD